MRLADNYIGYTWIDAGVIPFHLSADGMSNYWTGKGIIPVKYYSYTFGTHYNNRVYSLRNAYRANYALNTCKLHHLV